MSVNVTLDLGAPVLSPKDMGINAQGDAFISGEITLLGEKGTVTCVGFERPHCILYVARADDYDIERIGDALAGTELLPDNTVCDFVQVVNSNEIVLRSWGGGAPEPQKVQSAAASAVAAVLDGHCAGDITVHLLAGDVSVSWDNFGATVKVSGDSRIMFAI